MSETKPLDARRPTLFVLISITMVGQMAMNITLPSLSFIALDFGTTEAIAQLNLSLYLVGTAVAQLIFGPFSDHYGRRNIVLFGTVIFVFGSIVCLLAPSIETFIIGRIVQSVGGCAGIVMGRAMVRDMFSMDKAAAMIATLTGAVVIVPGLAPLLGGYFQDIYGWQLSIVFVMAVGLIVVLIAWHGAHETLPVEKRHEAHFSHLFSAFWILLKNRLFGIYTFQVTASTSAYFAFLGGSGIVFSKIMKWGSSTELGLWFFAVTIFYIAGNILTARYAAKIGGHRLNLIGTIIALVGTSILMFVYQTIGITPLSFFGLICFLGFGNGLCISSGVAIAIGADPHRVGAAAGLSGSLQLGAGGALATWVVSILLVDTPLPLIATIVILCFAGFIASISGNILFGARQKT
jgi:MFS transporter, DHA1 family, multidrug resistance protein